MNKILITYHSMTGAAQQMALACANAARTASGVTVTLKNARDTNADDLISSDGFVFCTPEYLGYISGIMKDLFDRTYYPLLDKIGARPYALMISAGSDGQAAARQMERILTGWRLRLIQPAIIVNVAAQSSHAILQPKQLSAEQLQPCQALGEGFANGLAAGIF
jgi:multimeric flavodoxin WrbA